MHPHKASLEIHYRRIDAIRPAANNPRTHSDAQISQLVRSISDYGWTNPILIDEHGVIIAGHGRLMAASKAGMSEVPTITLLGLTEEQKRALVIADNKLAMNAGWNDDLLRSELEALKALDFDVSKIGFSEDELAAILIERTEGLTDPDDVPEAPTEPVTVLGDVWLLGRHRLMCGDSTDVAQIGRLTQGALADLCFTSPPYGQQRDYKASIGDWDALMQGVFAAAPVKPEAQLLVNLGMIHRDGEWLPYWDGWIAWMREQGWRRFGWYVWDQGPGLPGRWQGRLAPSHEWIFHFNRVAEQARKTKDKLASSKDGSKARHSTGLRGKDGKMSGLGNLNATFQPKKIPDSVVRIMRHKARGGVENEHPAVFPVDLVSEMLTAFSDPEDIVYEPFCGSGTQLIGAQKNGRTCLAMEIAPQYCDVAVLRWQNFTGQTAVHATTGQPFGAADTEQAA